MSGLIAIRARSGEVRAVAMGSADDRPACRLRMTVVPMMTNRDALLEAGEILAEHGALTADYIIAQLEEVFGDWVAVANLRRVAAAIDEITGTRAQ